MKRREFWQVSAAGIVLISSSCRHEITKPLPPSPAPPLPDGKLAVAMKQHEGRDGNDIGITDGVNSLFRLSAAPAADSTLVFLNGVYQREGMDYSIAGAELRFTTAPREGDNVDVHYSENA